MNLFTNKIVNNCFFSLLLIISFPPQITFAQIPEKVNPLLVNFEDELLPKINRDLTKLERKRIQEKITELDTLADSELVAGNVDLAFGLWYRAINLSRALGVDSEVKMISKVGKIAWEKSRNEDITFLTDRLLIVEAKSTNNKEINSELLPLFIDAYEGLHNLDKSITINQKNLELARLNNEPDKIKISLDKLGQFYFAKFDYYRAQPIYEELLTIARINQDYLAEGIYLRKLAEINSAIIQPENALKYKQELAQNYLKNQNLLALSILKIAIGDDYKTLKKPEEATKSYQEAFNMAWELKQYAVAGDALQKLAKLYQEYEQLDSALAIYQELIKVQQLSYNLYGLMNSYDSMGIIYRQKQDSSSAIKSFQKALEISRNLKYKEDYFLGKLNEVITPEN
ncbi:MAG: tetratricopeptide repeat protein [Cyanobacteria bacterium]|nr:tetratricopeptide repeat protein [Cyanobacteria bacterium CG_2015-16_32_12]NCO79270.1 tetratricopeptide repeat protein [Cyanobacteria bacterium CG_2015-22_32_23]NCQ03533.1 tetratricopeptide repeat protein [Cyanobacteria bacterium CG_2015-09_32_10]NCQ41635.1 tetratricopeptide repeat protein [Cyanobacteria bacterium CG_2015-04_32_10]NCS85583.1 tetratricopeptide repeat protein [Cyanobacteria bacterium CG_2015-02_32_10]